jgi:HSP20 family molecular chaperone IbpA
MLDFWDEIAVLERRMDDIVRGFVGTRTRLAYPVLPQFAQKPFAPRMDVFGRDDDLVVKLELPGIDPGKDVTVEVREGMLVIAGERRREKEVKEEAYYRMEASYGAFERQIAIPEGIEESRISAAYADGVLEVIVPKGAAKEAEKVVEARKIPVLTGKKPAKAA